jgi:hypothetical protein
LGKRGRFLSAGRGPPLVTIFAQSKPSGGESDIFEPHRISHERRFQFMDYVVVFFTMLMIAGYACFIGRALRGTE